MLFKSFIVSLTKNVLSPSSLSFLLCDNRYTIVYLLALLAGACQSLSAQTIVTRKTLWEIFRDATSLGLELGCNLDSLVNKHTKSHIVQIYMVDEHFMQEPFERCPSGRLRHP
mgnify:CR=1 FL=1